MAVVTLDNAGKTYDGRPALEDITFAVPEGRCLALIGHNGAGKTTLMKLVLGLARPTSGSISVLGVDPANAGKSFRRELGFLPENVAFHDELTGADTLTFYARLKGRPTSECRAASRSRRADLRCISPGQDLFEGHAPAARPRPGPARDPSPALAR